jgi:hypothetical protein
MTQIELQYMSRVPSLLNDISKNLDTRTIAAIMFGQALISGKSYFGNAEDVAKTSVEYADALVKELNKTK